MKKVYLAGPMRGIADFNFPAFKRAAADLRSQGYTVFNPAEADERRHGPGVGQNNPQGSVELAEAQHGFCLREALAHDLDWICTFADAIALLPGWQNSKGATAERAVAEALGLEIWEVV